MPGRCAGRARRTRRLASSRSTVDERSGSGDGDGDGDGAGAARAASGRPRRTAGRLRRRRVRVRLRRGRRRGRRGRSAGRVDRRPRRRPTAATATMHREGAHAPRSTPAWHRPSSGPNGRPARPTRRHPGARPVACAPAAPDALALGACPRPSASTRPAGRRCSGSRTSTVGEPGPGEARVRHDRDRRELRRRLPPERRSTRSRCRPGVGVEARGRRRGGRRGRDARPRRRSGRVRRARRLVRRGPACSRRTGS